MNNSRRRLGCRRMTSHVDGMAIRTRRFRELGTITLAGLAAFIAAGLLIVSVAVSFEIGRSFGRTNMENILYGAGSACADGLKAVIFALSVAAYRRGCRAMSTGGFALFLLLTAFSFSSTVSFGLAARTYAGDVQLLQAEQNRSAITALRDDQRELARIRSRLRETDLSSRERRDLEHRNDALAVTVVNRQDQLALAPRIVTATTQADGIAEVLGVKPETITAGLAVLLALVMDLGPSVGFALAMEGLNSGKPSLRKAPKVRAPKVPPPQTPNLRIAARRTKLQPKSRPMTERSDVERSIAGFLEERTIKSGMSEATELFRTYQAYRRSLGLAPVSQRSFGDAMRRLGYAKDRRTASGRVQYLNVSLVENLRAAA